MAAIHPTAAVDPQARIAATAEVGPFCVLGPQVVLGEGCKLLGHVHLTGHTEIGAGTTIAPFSSLGTPPQSIRYRGGVTRLVVGTGCDIRESVTINTGTEDGGGVTQVGNGCLLMVGTHVGHDCRLGDRVTTANDVVLGGHVQIDDHVFVGGQTAIHQFVRVGEGAMIAGKSGIAADVIPFGFAVGHRSVLDGLNVIGLRRRGLTRADLHRVRAAYKALFLGPGLFKDRLAEVESAFAGDSLVAKITAFIRARQSRPLMMAGRSPVSDAAELP
jgi:UDP-N-acetylglucosamine acyltransferase